jgi:transcriptional regulator with XRE-family HTH domain
LISAPTPFATRLRSVVDVHGGASALARVIARSEGAVRKWLRAESEPSVTDLRAICEATATDIAWLVAGSAERTLQSPSAQVSGGGAADFFPDYALLETLLERVDTELARAHLALAATRRAALIVTLYQLSQETRTIDPDALTRLVTLARA